METIKESRTERKKEKTKQTIINVAMDLFMKQGFEQTTMDQIALEADVAKGTIYNHFPEKEAIISEHIQRVIREQAPAMIEQLEELPDTRSRLIAALNKSMEWMHIDLNDDLYERYFSYKMAKGPQVLRGQGPNLSSGFRTILESILEMGKQSGEIRKDVDGQFLAAQLELNYTIIAICWVTNPEMSSIQDSIAGTVELFLNGASSRNENC